MNFYVNSFEAAMTIAQSVVLGSNENCSIDFCERVENGDFLDGTIEITGYNGWYVKCTTPDGKQIIGALTLAEIEKFFTGRTDNYGCAIRNVDNDEIMYFVCPTMDTMIRYCEKHCIE